MLELRKEHNIVGAFINVPDVDGRTLAYCVTTAVRDFNGNMRTFFNVVTLDGRYISKGYKSAGAVTKWCRANRDEIAPVPAEDPSNQIAREMVETEDDISDPNTPVGRQAWSVVKLSRDAQKYAAQAEEHAKEAERLALEAACYADISEVSRTARVCGEQIAEAKRHTDLIRPEFEAAERLYRRSRWAHAAAYRISSVMFFSDGPWDAVMDDWTEKSSDAHASAMEYRDRAEGAIQDAGEDVRRAERQLDRACAVCGCWYPCTRSGRELTADLYDRGGYTCGCGGAVEDIDVPEPVELCAGQMSFDDAPEPDPIAERQHETTVTAVGRFYIPSCSCGWVQDINSFTEEEFASMRAAHHRREPHFDVDREPLATVTREIDATEFVAQWERHQYVIRWHGHALQVGPTAGEAFRRLEAGLRDNPEPYAAEMAEAESKGMGRGSMAPKRKAAAVKVGDIEFSAKNTFPCVATLLGHRYVVRKLAGSFSAQHEHSDGARLIFDGEDPKNICRTGGDMFPNLPALKRAILADAVARGEVEENQDQPERKRVTHADLFAVDGAELVALLDSLSEQQRVALAEQWPVRWLYPKQPGDRPRGINFCAGCGGGCKGKRLVSDADMVCVDLAGDAVATSEAAGCTVIRADVKTLTPEHPALRWTEETTYTMPCTDWTDAGTRRGRDWSNLEILTEAIDQVGFAYGNYEKDGTEYCDHEDNGEECTWEEGCFSSYGERTDMTVAEMWALVEPLTTKPLTCGLMLAPVIWCLGLRYIGAPLTRVVIEQAAALPEEIKDEIWLELNVAGCEQGEWMTLDAADFGSPSNRKRSIMAAHWYRRPGLPVAPGITTLAHDAIGWEPEAEVNTRGVRKTSGGNAFRMDGCTSRHPEPKPINGITSKIRGWYNAATGRRFTIEEVCLLVGLPADYPVQGSRSSQCQQLGDIFSPLVSLAVWGQLLGVPWRELLRRYLSELYPAVHGVADTVEIPVGDSPAGGAQDSAPADTEDSAPEWSYENERNPRPGCGSFPNPCNHAWPCGRDAVAWNKAQGKERAERAAATPGAKLTEGESRTYAGASDDGYGHNYEDMAYDWQIAEGRFRTKSNDLGDKHRFHGVSPKGDNGWTISVRCLHEACKGKVFTSVAYEAEALLAMRAHGKKKHPAPVAPTAGEPGFMAALLEKHVGADWKPLAATAEPDFEDVEEEPQAPAQGPLTREQRRAAWRLAAGEERKPSARVFEAGTLVLVDGLRAARVGASDFDFVRVRYADDTRFTHPVTRERLTRVLSCSAQQPVSLTVPRRAVALEEPQAPTCEALETYEVPEVPALVICGEPVTLTVPKRAVDPRISWAAYERPAPVDPRLAWMDYERPEPEQVDVLAELRAELEELRLDVEEWGAEVAALAVAEAERIVAEVARDMRAAELLELREEARAVREDLGWGPVVWEPIPGKPWRRAWTVAAGWAAGLIAAGAEGWREGTELALRQ
ncbi:DNA cytosine methyltransferase [Streptomyces amritsarensis]|uniref:hypothetical protein n=1 Tax=Streptomyces amritsarensis TaxID=681158 RepID=UPI0036A86973